MPMYSEELLDEIAAKNDIVDVISSYVSLKKRGGTYFGLCPFHNEKTPSFSVTPSKQMFYCFGCGAGGSVYTFLQKQENMTFPEAVAFLAEKAGVELPSVEMSPEQKRQRDRKARLFEIQKEAATYFYRLLRSDHGKGAYAYFKGRMLSDETMQKFGLGYSDKRSDDLYRFLKQKGYEDDLLRDSGLVYINEKSGGKDKFFNRAMFPIIDHQNRVIAFGGRVMGEGEPKYLNSPETPIFDKSRTLYGLHLARKTRADAFILCEGYMDVIALHQAGFDNAVASLGTAFTPGHASMIARYTKNVYLSFDSDGAGTNAKLRAIPILKDAGITCRIIHMEPYKDPDELIKACGPEEYQKRIDKAENSFLFSISALEQDYHMDDPTEKTAFFTAVAERILGFSDELERTNYMEAVADRYGMVKDDLRSMVLRLAAKEVSAGNVTHKKTAYAPEEKRTKNAPKRTEDTSAETQRLLLTWLADEPGLYPGIKNYISPEDFEEGILQTVAGYLFDQFEQDAYNPSQIVNRFVDDEEQQKVAAIFHTTIGEVESAEDKTKALREIVIRVKRDAFSRLRARTPDSDPDLIRRTIEEKKILKELETVDFYGAGGQ